MREFAGLASAGCCLNAQRVSMPAELEGDLSQQPRWAPTELSLAEQWFRR